MSIVTEIERIKTNIANAYTICQEKGATLPTILNSANLADCISSITGGSIDNGYVTDGLLIHLSGLTVKDVNYWKDTVRGNYATLYNTPTYDNENKCYVFNGSNQYGRFNLSGATKDFTLEVYGERISGSTRFDVCCGEYAGSKDGYGVCNNNGYSYCWIKRNTLYTPPVENRPTLIDDRKFYTRLSRETSQMYFNLKDIERNEVANFSANSMDVGQTAFMIAVDGTDKNTYGKCKIYAIRVYNRKLTDEEIQQNYEQDVRLYGN
jgi:hypothetical protein